jgi:ferredoxin
MSEGICTTDGEAQETFSPQKNSTKAFLDEARKTPRYSFGDILHGYIYARWLYQYIRIGIGEHWLAKVIRPVANGMGKIHALFGETQDEKPSVAENYHGKVLPIENAKQLVSINEPIELRNLEHIVPFQHARDIILKNPDHIVALECPCRSSRAEPCLPLDVCLIVGEPFASLVIDQHPRRSRWVNSKEAQSILELEHERGHVHHAYFKDAMLNRFYAICNCCSCCCGAMQAVRNGSQMIISSGYVSQVNKDLCIECEQCLGSCHFGALSMSDEGIHISQQDCMGCGVCVSVCSEGALSLELDPSKPIPLKIHDLMEAAAIHSL